MRCFTGWIEGRKGFDGGTEKKNGNKRTGIKEQKRKEKRKKRNEKNRKGTKRKKKSKTELKS